MIRYIKPLPISEEMLGAYLEGNLAPTDALYVDQILQDNDELSAFVNELSESDNLTSNYQMADITNFENDFNLPEISMEVGTSLGPHVLPLGIDPSFGDGAACAMMSDVTNDGKMIINNDPTNTGIDIISDIGMDINSGDLPIDGE